jgi:metal iron transporter
MVVAIAVGRSGVDSLLVVSQVVLSIVLPFVTFPLLYCTSNKAMMSIRKSRRTDVASDGDDALTAAELSSVLRRHESGEVEKAGDGEQGELVDYSNNKLTIAVGAAIWLAVVAANVYVIVELALGRGG